MIVEIGRWVLQEDRGACAVACRWVGQGTDDLGERDGPPGPEAGFADEVLAMLRAQACRRTR